MNRANERHQQFLALYSPLHDRLVRFVQVLIWDKEEVRDIVAETTLTALEQFDKVQHHEAFLYYLFTIARRKVNAYITRKYRFVPMDENISSGQIDNSKGVFEQLNTKELSAAIRRLPELYREPLVLFELSGFSIKEISGLLTISENGIKSRLVRARIMLSKQLGENSMNETQEQQANNEELVPRKTGNEQLDRLFNEAAIMPLAISSEEMLNMLPKVGTSVKTRMHNLKWIITGAIVLTGLVLYMIFPSRNIPVKEELPAVPSVNINSRNLKPEMKAENKIEAAAAGRNENKQDLQTEIKLMDVKKAEITANKNSIYIEGTSTVILEHDGRAIAIELNQSGVKKIVDSGVAISPDNYYDYNPLIEEAYAKTNFKYKPEIKSLSKKEQLAEAIIEGLYKEEILTEGQPYDLLLTFDKAILNEIVLSEENHQKMLAIVEKATGKPIDAKARIHISH